MRPADHLPDGTAVASLSADERAVVGALLHGATDAQAAAALGISRRTLNRRLRRAMDKFEAGSRLEFGYLLCRAAARGRAPQPDSRR